jgi:hypothetical protein
VRPAVALAAGLVLIAPTCAPLDYPPPDYDPDTSRPFEGYAAGSDLLYLQNMGSPKGDSVAVLAMPEGKVVGRIDGPDYGSLQRAGRTAFFAVTKSEGAAASRTFLDRADLQTGTRDARVDLGSFTRPPQAHLEPAGGVYRNEEWASGGIQLLPDGSIVVARIELNGESPVVRLSRRDAQSGRVLHERTWTTPVGAGVTARLAVLDNARFVLLRNVIRGGRVLEHTWTILDGDLDDRGSLSSARGEFPADASCDRPLRAGTRAIWVTLCVSSEGRGASLQVLTDGPAIRARAIPIPDVGTEGWSVGRPVSWTLRDLRALVFTDVWALVEADVSMGSRPSVRYVSGQSAFLRPTTLPPRFGADGASLYVADTAAGRSVVRVDVSSATIAARSATWNDVPDLRLSPDGSRVYAIVAEGQATNVLALDPRTLAITAQSEPLPEPHPFAIVAAVRPN